MESFIIFAFILNQTIRCLKINPDQTRAIPDITWLSCEWCWLAQRKQVIEMEYAISRDLLIFSSLNVPIEDISMFCFCESIFCVQFIFQNSWVPRVTGLQTYFVYFLLLYVWNAYRSVLSDLFCFIWLQLPLRHGKKEMQKTLFIDSHLQWLHGVYKWMVKKKGSDAWIFQFKIGCFCAYLLERMFVCVRLVSFK